MRYSPRPWTSPPTVVRVFVAICAFALFACAAIANAQSVAANPRLVSFIPSGDHNTVGADGQPVVTSYDLEVFLAGDAQPVIVLNLGKPAPAADGRIVLDFVCLLGASPPRYVLLQARVAAVGPTGRGESDPSNLFLFDSPSATPEPSPPAVEFAIPLLRILAPASATTVRPGQTVILSAWVVGDAIGVDFYVNGVFVGTATERPFQVPWTSGTTGKFTITAVTVANGVQVKSPPVVVIVGALRPRPGTAVPIGTAKRKKQQR